jgi:hypothetical protein
MMATYTLFALAPRRPRRSSPWNVSFWFGFLVNELPFVAFYWLVASTVLAIGQTDVDSPIGDRARSGLLATAGLVVVAWRASQTGPAVDQALNEGLGSEWRTELDPGMAARLRRRLPLARILFAPDLSHSIRFETVVDGIEALATWVRSRDPRHHANRRGYDRAPVETTTSEH